MHPQDCSGCPHCNEEMAAIMRDSAAGRYRSLANRMAALTHRTLRALGAKPNHPAYRALRLRDVPPPPTIEDWVSSIECSRNGRHARDSHHDRLAALLSAGQSRPTSRTITTNLATSGTVPSAPDLAVAIRAVRSNKE